MNPLFEELSCYFSCIAGSSTNFILFGLLLGALILGVLFLYNKRSNYMFLSQIVSSLAIVEGFRQMSCSMAGYVWGYFGIISGSLVFLGIFQVAFNKQVRSLEISDAQFMRRLSQDMGSQTFLFDTQRIKAFTHKRQIYLSVGLVELLDYDELKAVAAHELYHVKYTPNRFVANSLAVASFWLRSYRDEAKADRFAAEFAGKENLISAFEKLRILGVKKRIKRLAA